MSEENRNVEFKDNELEKSTGGYTVLKCDFEEGDCFESNVYIFKVLHTIRNVEGNTLIECLLLYKDNQNIRSEDVPASYLMSSCKYIGNNVF